MELAGITGYREAARQLNGNLVVGQSLAHTVDYVRHDVLYEHPLAARRDISRVELGRLQQACGQLIQPHGFLIDRQSQFALFAGSWRYFDQSGAGGTNDRQRRLEFMRKGVEDSCAELLRSLF